MIRGGVITESVGVAEDEIIQDVYDYLGGPAASLAIIDPDAEGDRAFQFAVGHGDGERLYEKINGYENFHGDKEIFVKALFGDLLEFFKDKEVNAAVNDLSGLLLSETKMENNKNGLNQKFIEYLDRKGHDLGSIRAKYKKLIETGERRIADAKKNLAKVARM